MILPVFESMPVTSCAPSGDHEAGGQKYVSLQNNNSQSHPELTGNTKIILMIRITSGCGSGSLRPPAGQTHSCNCGNATKQT